MKSLPISKLHKQSCTKLKGISSTPALDTNLLLLDVLGQKESSWLLAHADEELTPAELTDFEEKIKRRLAGEPIAYILGEWEFFDRPFFVNSSVLVPRPETEELVEKSLKYLADRPATVVDLGTGSGVVAITLALENPQLKVIAVDISEDALAVAKKNAERHKVSSNIDFVQGNFMEPIVNTKVDLVVSNPPYVPTKELENAKKSIETIGLTFEPQIALDGGETGLDYVEKIEKSKIPAFVETKGGKIQKYNL